MGNGGRQSGRWDSCWSRARRLPCSSRAADATGVCRRPRPVVRHRRMSTTSGDRRQRLGRLWRRGAERRQGRSPSANPTTRPVKTGFTLARYTHERRARPDRSARAASLRRPLVSRSAGTIRDEAYGRRRSAGRKDRRGGLHALVTTRTSAAQVGDRAVPAAMGHSIRASGSTAWSCATSVPAGAVQGTSGPRVLHSGPEAANSVAIQPDGKIVVAGYAYWIDFDRDVLRHRGHAAEP